MNKEQIEGVTQKAGGAVKEAAGKALGDRDFQAEGAGEKLGGTVRKAVGDVKAAIHKATK